MMLLPTRAAACAAAAGTVPFATIRRLMALLGMAPATSTPSAASFQTHAEFKLPRELPPSALAPVAKQSHLSGDASTQIATLDTHEPVAALCVAVPCGARYEDADSLGMAHYMKHFAFLGTTTQSKTRLAYEARLRAATFDCRVTRDHMLYRARFMRDDIDYVIETLSDVISNPVFPAWELDNVDHKAEADSRAFFGDPACAALEQAYSLAFRKHPLANSVSAMPDTVPHVSPAKLVTYAAEYAKANSKMAAIAAVGVGHDELIQAASKSHFGKTPGTAPAQQQQKQRNAAPQWFSGSARIAGRRNCILLAFPTPPASEVGVRAALQTIGVLIDPHVRLSVGNIYGSPWGAGLWRSAGRPLEAHTRVFHDTHKDGGLFCIESVGECSKSTTEAARLVVDALRALAANSNGVARGVLDAAVRQSRMQERLKVEGREALATALAVGQTNGYTLEALDAAYTKLTGGKVSQSAQKILKAPLSFVVVGETAKLPYPEDLGF